MGKQKDLAFAEITERLQAIADVLEGGDTPLEEALSLFEEGVRLSKLGTQRLEEAERRIEQLLQGDEVAAVPDEEAPSASE